MCHKWQNIQLRRNLHISDFFKILLGDSANLYLLGPALYRKHLCYEDEFEAKSACRRTLCAETTIYNRIFRSIIKSVRSYNHLVIEFGYYSLFYLISATNSVGYLLGSRTLEALLPLLDMSKNI